MPLQIAWAAVLMLLALFRKKPVVLIVAQVRRPARRCNRRLYPIFFEELQ